MLQKTENLGRISLKIRVVKPKNMRWVRHIGRMGNAKCTETLSGTPESKGHLRDLYVDGTITSRRSLKKYDVMIWTVLIWYVAASTLVNLPISYGPM
jgi:hypothetical protein